MKHLSTEATQNPTNNLPAANSPRLLYSRAESAYLLSISTRALDYLISQKKLRVRRMGRKICVPHGELVRFSRADHSSLIPTPIAA